MKELSLNILDIAENSVKAGATLTEIDIDENDKTLKITIADNGCGMSPETLSKVMDPFYTTRTTRRVGMGIPLFKMEAEQTGGRLDIKSQTASEAPNRHGTVVSAIFNKEHIDFIPLGNVTESVITLIHGHPDTDFKFTHKMPQSRVSLDTREIRAVLDDVPLNEFQVLAWIKEYLNEQYL